MNEKGKQRLEHVRSHLDGWDINRPIDLILSGRGSEDGCLGNLESYCLAKAMDCWFTSKDLVEFKRWALTKSLLKKRRLEVRCENGGALGYVLDLRLTLLSDDEELISWFSNFEKKFNSRTWNHKTVEYYAYQYILAIRGEWNKLVERNEVVLRDPPKASELKKFIQDYAFFSALAEGDVISMERELARLVTPGTIRARHNTESGYTNGLISTYAVLFSKIAHRHGFILSIDSPYLPKEWLPIKPLESREPFLEPLREYLMNRQ